MSVQGKYLGFAFAILCAEILIGTTFASIPFIRGNVSDFLVVAFIYFLARAINPIKPAPLAMGVFFFACAVEISQHWHLADALGLAPGTFFYILLGNTFSFMDILMYLLGSVAVFVVDVKFLRQRSPPTRLIE